MLCVVFGVGGGIVVYKVVYLLWLFIESGYVVCVVFMWLVLVFVGVLMWVVLFG